MSDLYMCELEDNVWDDFRESDDHIVPHPGDKCGDHFAVQGDSCKKPQHVLTGVTSNIANASNYSVCEEGKRSPILTKKDRMLEKGSWSQASDGMFPSSCDNDSLEGVTRIESGDTRMSTHCFKSGKIDPGSSELCANNPILGDKCAAVDENLYRYPFSNMSHTDDELSFLENDHEDKESSHLLSYWWPNIENFEDVDRMFRSCDSSFGVGSLSNEDELSWFSSSHATELSEDAFKSDNNFSVHKANALKSISSTEHDDLNKKTVSMGDRMDYQTSDIDDPAAPGQLSFVKGPDMKTESREDLMPKEETNMHRKQSKNHNQTERKRKDRYLQNGGSSHYFGKLGDPKHCYGDSSHEALSALGSHQHKQSRGPDALCYRQTHIPCMHLECSHPSDQISLCPALSGNRSENSGHTTSTKESSYASNLVQSMESSHGHPLDFPAKTNNGRREKLCQDLQTPIPRKFKHLDMSPPMEFGHIVSAQKQVLHSENEVEAHGEVEGVSVGIPTEFDSSNVPESSCISSALNEISLEANNFRQLQQVTEQLDIRTKLCIRDSLYRLARSAEQRHNCANLIGGNGDDRDAGRVLMVQETNKCTGFVDVETGTNPIDRSIAHLLFHRPSDASVVPANNAVSLKSQALINGSVTSPPAMAETQVFQEGTVVPADKKTQTLMTENK